VRRAPPKPPPHRILLRRLRHEVCSRCGTQHPAAKGFEPVPRAGVCENWGVIKWYIPPPPGVFRKDINPWGLLTNFSQGYHSKRLLDAPVAFPKKLVYGLVFCRWRGDRRPPEREGQSDWFYALFGHTSILQDGASTSSTNAVLG
jgi:hypothetical protein